MIKALEKAATRYLQRCDYELIDEVDNYIVAKEGNSLIFCEVLEKLYPNFDDVKIPDRSQAERHMIRWLSNHDGYTGLNVRIDQIAFACVEPSRALLRHHINAIQAA